MSGVNGQDVGKQVVDSMADAQAARLKEKAAKQEREKAEAEAKAKAQGEGGAPPAANDPPVADAVQQVQSGPAGKQKVFEAHVELFSDGSFGCGTDFRNPEGVIACVTALIRSLVQMQVEMQLKAAIAKAEATMPKGQTPWVHKMRSAFRSAVSAMGMRQGG